MTPIPINKEKTFDPCDFIVSRTDLQGRLTYCNRVFVEISCYQESELLGQQHSIIRHPDMPRCIFKLLWDTILSGEEIFAYVKNLCKDGSFYWVIAHVTPTYDTNNQMTGFHSNRRVPGKREVQIISKLYADLLAIEQTAADRRTGLQKSYQALTDIIAQNGVSYDQYILTL